MATKNSGLVKEAPPEEETPTLIPTEVTVEVKSVVTNSASMTIGDTTYNSIAIVCLEADRDDVQFVQLEGDTELLIAVNWYGMYMFPYDSTGALSDTIPIGIRCAGVEATDETITMANFLSIGSSATISLSQSDDSGDEGDDSGDEGGGT